MVHLIQVDQARGPGSGSIDHVAFHATDYEDFTGHLKGKGIAYDERVIADRNVRQVFLTDPNGVKSRTQFPTLDIAGGDALGHVRSTRGGRREGRTTGTHEPG